MEDTSFSYVDIVTTGCEGWLNLFFGDQIIAMIIAPALVDKIREEIPKKEPLGDK